MNNPIMPSARIREDGSKTSVEDSPYELGMYYRTIGLPESDNPYPRTNKMAWKLFNTGWKNFDK